MEKAQILIVEDDAIIAMDLESRLKNLGFSVPAIVASGEKAIEKTEALKPDLVLMDIVLQGEMDGIEAAEIIRSRFDIPVVFLTAYADEERFERAKLTYPFGFIIKPFQDRDLKVTIKMALYVAKIDAERKQAEEALHQYEHIVSSSTDMLALLDKRFKYLAANEAYIEAFKLTPEQLIGNTVADVFGKEFFNTVIKPHGDRCLGGEETNYQSWFDFPAHERRYMDVTYYPYYGEDNMIMGFVVSGRNITERKNLELELEQHNKHLEQLVEKRTTELKDKQIQLFQTSKLATLGEMATGIAHEINQPLSGIALVAKTFQKLMDRKQLSHEEIESGLHDITLSVKRISKIIDHVRAFARQDTVEFSLVDIGTTVQSALDLLQTQLKLRGIGVDLSIAADLPQVLGEPYQLEQVWINIIGNARDALDEKAKRLKVDEAQDMDYRKMLRITINSDPQEDIPAIEVCFADNGIGLNPEEKEKIFVPFFTTKEMGKGTGLGMSICHGIIQTHKGTITVDSEVNQGAAIRVRLPAAS